MEYTPEFLKKMTTVGALGYHVNKIINVLDVLVDDEKQFIADFRNQDSVIRRAFNKGVDKSDFQIDQKLFELASSGDMKAIEKYEQRKNQQEQIV